MARPGVWMDMSDFSVRSDAVDVEQIMRQIRARVREKRGADYTETEIQKLASVKLEKFLDPRGVRSDLVAEFRRQRPVPEPCPNFVFEADTIYQTHRGPLRLVRRLLNPLLKLFFNPNKISDALHLQSRVNTQFQDQLRQREAMDPLFYEVVHNLVLEITRLGIEVHNLTMKVESLSSRLDFDERRGRALEQVVQYRPQRPPARDGGGERPAAPPPATGPGPGGASRLPPAAEADTEGEEPEVAAPSGAGAPMGRTDSASGRRRRRRRRRRPGTTFGDRQGGEPAPLGTARDGEAGREPSADRPAGPDSGAGDQ